MINPTLIERRGMLLVMPNARINCGPWLTNYSWVELSARAAKGRVVLPICSLGTPSQELESLGDFVLPPLFHEAMDADLRQALLARIAECFPYHVASPKRGSGPSLQVVDLPRQTIAPPPRVPVVACCIDTAVEEHGPHLPLATDRIQSMAVLGQLARERDDLFVAPPLDYGQLAWALPIGWSVDLTAALTTRYVAGYVRALQAWLRPRAMYVVCVHGSRIHHEAVRAGLSGSAAPCQFRWLHEALSEYTWSRGDAHAGGVETALVAHINPDLVDARWWPARADDLQRQQMTLESAIAATADLNGWIGQAPQTAWNGIVGRIENAQAVDPAAMMGQMLELARRDVQALMASM